MNENVTILWADDEIELLKAQLLFLEKKGYEVTTVTNGYDALEEVDSSDYDLVFLDESMPGLTGLETLEKIKQTHPSLPVIMITKNEAETVMEEALGAQISDYLIKPVNPNQILLAVKKIIDNKRLIREKTMTSYQQEFRSLSMEIADGPRTQQEWVSIYKKIIEWELRLDQSQSSDMQDILTMQKREANAGFSRFVVDNYLEWLNSDTDQTYSYNLFRNKVFPLLSEDMPTVFILLDNLRYDQIKVLEDLISENFRKTEEDYFYSILPTTTQYSRNSIFAGMPPDQIERSFKDFWLNDNEEGGKNMHEEDFLAAQIKRTLSWSPKWKYHKVTSNYVAKQIEDNCLNFLTNDLTVIVYNFIDMLSHARTEMEVLKELASDEKAYRSITRAWFENSPLWGSLKKLSEHPVQIIITTDHGTIRVKNPVKVVGDRETTTNLRYKVGRNLKFPRKDVLALDNPQEGKLPRPNVSSKFIFALEDDFFLYPNNYNYYNNYYRDTFQHGGVSLEEMICPFYVFKTK